MKIELGLDLSLGVTLNLSLGLGLGLGLRLGLELVVRVRDRSRNQLRERTISSFYYKFTLQEKGRHISLIYRKEVPISNKKCLF